MSEPSDDWYLCGPYLDALEAAMFAGSQARPGGSARKVARAARRALAGDLMAASALVEEAEAATDARVIAVGRSPRGPGAQFADGSFTTAVTHAAAFQSHLLQVMSPTP